MMNLNGIRFVPNQGATCPGTRRSTVKFNGIEAELSLFLLKTPAEHVLGTTLYPLEIQFKHQGTGQNDPIIFMSILYQEGQANPVLEDLFYYVERTKVEQSPSLAFTSGVNLDRFTRDLGSLTEGDSGGSGVTLE